MSASPDDDPPLQVKPHRGQLFFDNIFLLLGLGIVVMFVLYTGWGMLEILTLPRATLP